VCGGWQNGDAVALLLPLHKYVGKRWWWWWLEVFKAAAAAKGTATPPTPPTPNAVTNPSIIVEGIKRCGKLEREDMKR
jgi:hypothetical protein